MGSFSDKMVSGFRRGNVAVKLIYVNAALFLLQWIFLFFCRLLKLNAGIGLLQLQLPAGFQDFLSRPWSLFTYFFLHDSLMQLVFNMLVLFFAGRFFLLKFSAARFRSVYVLGGILGGGCYLLAYNLIPTYRPFMDNTLLQGSSAAVMALVMAVAFSRPNERLTIPLLGSIAFKWLAVIVIVIDLLSLNGENAGGSFAHLGGALTGVVAGLLFQSGRPVFHKKERNRFFHGNGKKSAFHGKYHRSASEKADTGHDSNGETGSGRCDAILDKIKASGYESLTAEEKRILFEQGRR